MSKLTKNQKVLMWTILIVALVQMPNLALSPAIDTIKTTAFPDKELAEIQTVMALQSLASLSMSVIAALLINKGIISKKIAVAFGLFALFLTGVFAALFNSAYWSFVLMNILLGVATGFYMTNNFGLLFDNFDEEPRQAITGYQTSFINGGGILLGIAGGLAAARFWYGGYLIFLVGLPIMILVLLTVPGKKTPARKTAPGEKRAPINPGVFYYAAIVLVFMAVYNVCGTNISTHISTYLQNKGGSAVSGVAAALQMGGGAFAGIFFGKLSAKLKDKIMVLACLSIFVGFMLLALFPHSLIMILLGAFIAGMSMSMMLPHCTFRVSQLVDETTSATGTVIATSVAPSFGVFISPVIFTNLTQAISPDSTVFRYAFVGALTLVFGAVLYGLTVYREKKGRA
ncbi:MAG TPA: MFS transporter [Papillibacter sp.]|jgi:MFS family permease|nr:MFS transporter [Papillibacter sp.]